MPTWSNAGSLPPGSLPRNISAKSSAIAIFGPSPSFLEENEKTQEGVSAIVEGWCGGGGRFIRIDSPKTTLLKGHHRREKTVSYRQSGRENRNCEHRAVRKGQRAVAAAAARTGESGQSRR